MDDDKEKSHWLLRNFPFIGGLVLQTVSLAVVGSYQLAKMDARVATLEATDSRIFMERDRRRSEVDQKIGALTLLSERMVKTETTLDAIQRVVTRIENKLDRTIPDSRNR